MREATKLAQAPATLQQDLVDIEDEATHDEALSGPLQGIVHPMNNMMAMILELPQKVHDQDTPAAEQITAPLAIPSTSLPARRKARHQDTLPGILTSKRQSDRGLNRG